MAPSIGAFHTLFIFRREGCRAQAVIPGSAMARATLLQREETHRALTQAVMLLLEGTGVDDGSSLVERLRIVGGVAHAQGMPITR